MTHKTVLNKFVELFVPSGDGVECWYPNGKNCIRIKTDGGWELIFTYFGKKKWRIETVDFYVDGLEGKNELRN